MTKLVLIIALLLLCVSAFATNAVYIALVAAGANDGTSCANAKIYTYFNTAGNWSATPSGIQIGPDTTVAGCGSGTVTPLAAIQSSALNTTALTNASWSYSLDAVVSANGASCALVVKGSPGLTIETGATTGAPDSVFADSNTAASSPVQTCTNALFLDFFVQQSTTGASNSYKQLVGLIR